MVEAKLDKGQGPVATAIVKRGSLEVGQFVVVGCHWGKLRSLRTAAGKSISKALPGQPVEIAGLKGVPQAGDQLQVLPRFAACPHLKPTFPPHSMLNCSTIMCDACSNQHVSVLLLQVYKAIFASAISPAI